MRLLLLIVILAVGLVAPFYIYPVFLMKLLCFALFASAYNLLLGFTGLLSFGHAAFFGVAGYAAGHAMKVWGLTPELGLLFGTISAAILGYVMGWLAIRRQGTYFAMITLALSQVVYFICVQAPFTGAEDGLQNIPRGKLFGVLSLEDHTTAYYFVCAIFLLGYTFIFRVVHSPFGQILKAIRDNEPRALSMGYDVAHFKLKAFVISAGLAGLAGGTKAFAVGLTALTDVSWQMSGEVILMTLLGGIGTLAGPALGASLVVTLQNYLSGAGSWVLVIMGLTFVICVLLFRRGLAGELSSLRDALRRRGHASEVARNSTSS